MHVYIKAYACVHACTHICRLQTNSALPPLEAHAHSLAVQHAQLQHSPASPEIILTTEQAAKQTFIHHAAHAKETTQKPQTTQAHTTHHETNAKVDASVHDTHPDSEALIVQKQAQAAAHAHAHAHAHTPHSTPHSTPHHPSPSPSPGHLRHRPAPHHWVLPQPIHHHRHRTHGHAVCVYVRV